MKLSNLKIGTRLHCGFGLLCGMLLLILGIATSMLSLINDNATDIANNSMAKLEGSAMVLNNVNAIEIALNRAVLARDAAEREQEAGLVLKKRAEVDQLYRSVNPASFDARGRQVFEQASELNKKYSVGQDTIIASLRAGDEAGARAYLAGELKAVLTAYDQLLSAQMAQQKVLGKASAAQGQRKYILTRNLLLILGMGILLLSAVSSWWITRSITRPIARALEIANTVAAGELSSHIVTGSTDETGQLLQALKRMNENLIATVSAVRAGTDTIISASTQVANGSIDLSARTEQQAGALEETASSMEELTSIGQQNADKALRANDLAENASAVAARGGSVIDQVVGTMTEIDRSSMRIADIIGVIDGIAFQTNILALNASVEAARAGEQGRGFAVVANEVRNLAHRSAAAAKEIKLLIQASTRQVQAGSELVAQAGSTMRDIVDSVKRVTDIMAEIRDASREQTAGIGQINEAILQIDTATQQNAALVEETSAAATEMRGQAERLAQAVSVFKLDDLRTGRTDGHSRQAVSRQLALQ